MSQEAEIITLPPYEVEVDRGKSWRYARIGAIEALARTPDDITVAVVDRYQRLMHMLDFILPPRFRPSYDVPTTLIIEDAVTEPLVVQELTATLKLRITNVTGDTAVRFMPNFNFRDDDTELLYMVLDPYVQTSNVITLSASYLGFLLDSNHPPLPSWFIDGLLQLQDTLMLPVPPATRQITFASDPRIFLDPKHPYDEVTVLPFVWGNKKSTDEIIAMVKREARISGRPLLPDSFALTPLEKLLNPRTFTAFTGEEQTLATLQSALFLRWILDPHPVMPDPDQILRPGGKPDAEALWRFLDRVTQEGFSDKLFVECFAWSPAEVDVMLRFYLPYACLGRGEFRIGSDEMVHPLNELPLHDATPAELARLKGRLNRLSIRYVRQHYPEVLSSYLEQARRNHRRAVESAQSDPVQLAELGLAEVDAGNDATALPLLVAAVQGKVVHPRAYYELSRIEMVRLREKDPDLKTVGSELDDIAQQLTTGLGQKPALAQAYKLLLELWLRKMARLTAAQVALLDEGARRFPEQFRIIYAAVLLQTAQGDVKSAERLGTLGMRWLTDQTERDKLGRLMETLHSSKP